MRNSHLLSAVISEPEESQPSPLRFSLLVKFCPGRRGPATYMATAGLPENSEAHSPSSRLSDSTVNIRN